MDNVVSLKFRYDGKVRRVHNVTFDNERGQFIGFEVRKSGRFSQRVKRYDIKKVDENTIEFITINRKVPS